jgi:hypothetical protein
MPGFTSYQYNVTEATAVSALNGPTVSYQKSATIPNTGHVLRPQMLFGLAWE